jgi:hypothetical protein
MKKASNYAYIGKRQAESSNNIQSVPASMKYGAPPRMEADLNVFVLTFDGMKEAEKNLSGGDHYPCKKCGAILNKFSLIVPASQVK